MYPEDWPLPYDGGRRQHEQGGSLDPHAFINALPPAVNTTGGRITRQSIYHDTYEGDLHAKKTLLWPALAVTLPLVLLSAALLGLIFGYRVEKQEDLFWDSPAQLVGNGTSVILVEFSASKFPRRYVFVDCLTMIARLVFAASFLSTVAPLLTGPVMTLWSVISSASMSQASNSSRFGMLPTPFQLSILIGLCLASMEQLRVYIYYTCSAKRKIAVPPVLDKAGLVMLLALSIATGVFVSDTVLHYLTSTIVFDQIETVPQSFNSSGRGLSKLCLDLDRVKDNGGFPCSFPVGLNFADPNATENYNEISRLQSNESTTSQIRLAEVAGIDAHVALVLPNPAILDARIDYRASTVGVATDCQLVSPDSCKMRAEGTGQLMTAFNCSENFFGLLGKAPNTTATDDGSRAEDPDLSPLAFKTSSNLQYAFFTAEDLQTVYNPEAWDPATNIPDLKSGLPDNQLLNPIYSAFAVQGYPSLFSADSEMLGSSLVYNNSENIVAFVMTCSITTYDVQYVWYKSALQNVSATISPNGTLLEVFHGNQMYQTVAGGFDLQFNLVSASLAGRKISDYLGKWQDLYSLKVLSHIGGHLSPRTNLQEQYRESSLVAQVPKAALGALVGFSLLYSVMGSVLVVAAYKARSPRVSAIAEQLSLAGLTLMAFGEGREKELSGPATPHVVDSGAAVAGSPTGKKTAQSESRRVRIDGTDFQVWV